jgi:hypothetical protein
LPDKSQPDYWDVIRKYQARPEFMPVSWLSPLCAGMACDRAQIGLIVMQVAKRFAWKISN